MRVAPNITIYPTIVGPGTFSAGYVSCFGLTGPGTGSWNLGYGNGGTGIIAMSNWAFTVSSIAAGGISSYGFFYVPSTQVQITNTGTAAAEAWIAFQYIADARYGVV